ncbi:MAG: alpha/beta fold hydrolase, partial [Stackebrandtia sp.]
YKARRLLLTSRRGMSADGAADLVAELEALGASADVAACDMSDREAVRELLSGIKLGTVVHAAAAVDDGIIEALDTERLDRVVRAKADSAAILDELTAGTDLDAFVLFSSMAGTITGPGQANYVAANSYLDELARDRRRRGLPAVCLAWGFWSQRSELTDRLGQRDVKWMAARTGVVSMSTDQGLALFDAALEADDPCVVTARFNPRLIDHATAPRVLRGLFDAAGRRRSAHHSHRDGSDLRVTLATASTNERRRLLMEWARPQIAGVLQLRELKLAPDETFRDIGFDSLTAVELRNRINAAFGLKVRSNFVFEHPTPQALVDALAGELDNADLSQPVAAAAPMTKPAAESNENVRSGPGSNVGDLFIQACAQGQYPEVVDLLRGMAKYRPQFSTPAELNVKLGPVPLTDGPAEPLLVCLPPYIWNYSSRFYSSVLEGFRHPRSAIMFHLPGYREGEPLPASVEALAEVLANAVREAVGDTPFAMLGHSGGGSIAAVVTAQLERTGTKPDGLILLDTVTRPLRDNKPVLPVWARTVCRHLANEHLARRHLAHSKNRSRGDAWVTAQARYSTFNYRVSRIEAPTLLVRATELFPGLSPTEDGWKPEWYLDHTTVDTSGNHTT